jgi:hypothetical protein
MSKPTSENLAFGFQLTTEQAHVFHQWQEDTSKAIVDYQLTTFKQKNPLVGEIGGLLRIIVMPHAEQWQLQIHLTKFELLPVLEPLTITEGITPVHDKGEGSLTIQRKNYQRLLEHGWTFATPMTMNTCLCQRRLVYFHPFVRVAKAIGLNCQMWTNFKSATPAPDGSLLNWNYGE